MKIKILLAIIVAHICLISATANSAPIRFRVRTIDPDESKAQYSQTGSPIRESGLYAVQFDGPILPKWKALVESSGIAIVGYVPENTLVVRVRPGQLAKVKTLPNVRWVGYVSADLKVEPELLSHKWDLVNVVMKLTSPGAAEDVSEQLQSYGATAISIATDTTTLITATVPKDALLAIAELDDVQWIEEWIQPRTTNNVAGEITGTGATRERLGLYGEGQVIGIADTGLDTGSIANIHPDFAGRIVKSYALRRANDWSDLKGHGTHVAGIMAGSGVQSGSQPSNHDYTDSFAGAAPEADIIFQSIGDSSGNVFPPLNLDNLFSPVYTDGARVHNDSWGSPADGKYTVYSQQVDEYVWEHKDVVVVFPVGNDATDRSAADGVVGPSSLYTLATAKNCISVGATESNRTTGRITTYGGAWPYDFSRAPIYGDYLSNNAGGMVAWSGRGPCADGRIKPDICTPGTNIVSARSQAIMNIGWQVYDSSYVYWGGTSMSAPLVSGAAALVREYFIKNKSLNPSAALVKGMLMNAATELFPGQYGNAESPTKEIRNKRPDISEGWGRLNLTNALEPAAPRVVDFVDDTSGIGTQEERQYQYTVLDGSIPLSVTLAWTDYPGQLLAARELVNDLDLEVIHPNGYSKSYGNGSGRDSLNNVETVDIETPSAGTYTVKVKGYNVPLGPQPYALVVSAKLPGSYIAGQITTATGKPVAAATVEIDDGSTMRSVTTDGNGSYTLHVSPGVYTVTPDKSDWQFSPSFQQVTITDHGEPGIDFTGSAIPGGISGNIIRAMGGMTNYVLESPHPYPDDYNLTYTIEAHPSATQIRVHFADLYVQEGYDYVAISTPDESQVQYISGGYSDLWSDWFDGNSLVIKLVSDYWYNDWGYYLDGYETDITTSGGVDGVKISALPYGIETTSQNGGEYILADMEPVSYDLSPTKPHWNFSPATKSVSVTPGKGGSGVITLPGIDFLGFAPASLAGVVTTGDVRSFPTYVASDHPYYDDWVDYWNVAYTGGDACDKIRVHFSEIDTEEESDFVLVMTPYGDIVNSFTGYYPDGVWSDWVDGNELWIKFVSDPGYGSSNDYWGFAIDEYMIVSNERPVAGVRVELESGQSAMTNASGQYLISDIDSGQYYSVTAKKPGYQFAPAVQYANTVSGLTGHGGDFFALPGAMASLSLAKSLSDGDSVILEDLVVTAGNPSHSDFFYVESADRTSGIRVAKEQHDVQTGDVVNISGTLSTLDSGERVIINPAVEVVGSGSVCPLGITNLRLGGGSWLYDPTSGAGQIGITGSVGLNNIGLLVTTWGRVTAVSNSYPEHFYVDDGSSIFNGGSALGIYVDATGLQTPQEGSYVSVSGISSCELSGGKIVCRLLPRTQDDITIQDSGVGKGQ
ncbi:MAG: S8 family serine peptidase [Armatimonadetes bacterium]|nr:S8 family serine peptidase [Armatimonadota bacterium]